MSSNSRRYIVFVVVAIIAVGSSVMFVHQCHPYVRFKSTETLERADPLWKAIVDGNFDQTKRLLDAHPNWINRPSGGRTPLYEAVARNREYITALLLARGAEVNARVGPGWDGDGNTPIVAAVLNRNPRLLRLLIDHHADVSVRDGDGHTLDTLAIDWPEGQRILHGGKTGATLPATNSNG